MKHTIMVPPFAEFPPFPAELADSPGLEEWLRKLRGAMEENYRRIRRGLWQVGPPVASASSIEPSGNIFHVTGTTGISTVTISVFNPIVLIFDGILTVTDGSNLKLAGNFTTTADDVLMLMHDGTNYFELGRSVN